MADPVWTQDDLDAVNLAIRRAMKGQTVSFADRSWTSQDLSELLKLKAQIVAALNESNGFSAYRLAAHSKDL